MTQLFLKQQQENHQNHASYLKLHFQQVQTKEQLKKTNKPQKNKIADQNALIRHQEQSKKTRFLIKLNKNIQNAFPINFFSNPTTNKNESSKKYYSAHKNHLKISLESMNHYSKQLQEVEPNKIKLSQRYQSIQVQPVSQALILKPQQQLPQNLCRFRSSRSLQTSIDRREIKNQSAFSFEKEKDSDCNILPNTAATLQNLDEEDFFNITFGNGWKKNNGQKDDQKQKSSVIFNKNDSKQSKIFRLRNVQSLQLKKPCVKSLEKKQGFSSKTVDKCAQKQGNFSRSERKSVTNHFKKQKVFKMYNNQDSSQNKFIKLKLNVDEIVNKKTTILPKMKNPLGDFSKKDKLNKLNKLMKLVF